MIKNNQFLQVLLLLLSLPAIADSYRYSTDLLTSSGGDSFEQLNLGSSVFFSAVDIDSGPLAEAAFLAQASNISLFGQWISDDVDENVGGGVSVRSVHRGSGLLAEFAYRRNILFEREAESYRIELGRYLTETSAVSFGYEVLKQEGTMEVDRYFGGFKQVSTDAGLLYGYNINGTFGFLNFDDDSIDSEIYGQFDTSLYLSRNKSVELGGVFRTRTQRSVLAAQAGDEVPIAEEDEFEFYLGFRWYVKPELALSAEFRGYRGKGSDNTVAPTVILDRDVVSVGMTYRM